MWLWSLISIDQINEKLFKKPMWSIKKTPCTLLRIVGFDCHWYFDNSAKFLCDLCLCFSKCCLSLYNMAPKIEERKARDRNRRTCKGLSRWSSLDSWEEHSRGFLSPIWCECLLWRKWAPLAERPSDSHLDSFCENRLCTASEKRRVILKISPPFFCQRRIISRCCRKRADIRRGNPNMENLFTTRYCMSIPFWLPPSEYYKAMMYSGQ